MALARTQYVRSGDVDIAYQVIGDGPRDLVLVFDNPSHLEALPEQPLLAEFILALGRFARVLWFDMQGQGMSGHAPGGVIPVESWMDDLIAVMEAEQSATATIVAKGYAAQMAVVAAATRPERVASLVLLNGFARFARAGDYPAGLPESAHERFLDNLEAGWGSGSLLSILVPSWAGRPGVEEWWGRVERYAATPGHARARMRAVLNLDVRDVLPLVDAPTLVVHSRHNDFVRFAHGQYLAERIPGARLLERPGSDHWSGLELVGAIEEFITGTRSKASDSNRALATVLFVDVVGSTRYASEQGDRSWEAALDRFEGVAGATLPLHEGVLERHTGDGVLATFDGPARAIRCASQIRDEVRISGLEVRCGLHAGEVTRRPEGIAGVAIHIGARVCALAAPGEVLVTRTVRDLVAGSGISFEERGEHELKGVPDSWMLYATTS